MTTLNLSLKALLVPGGFTPDGYSDTVESYNQQDEEECVRKTGWQIEPQMELNQYRAFHCSLAVGAKIVLIGGYVGSSSSVSSSVEVFDLENGAAGWAPLASLPSVRRSHACSFGQFNDQSKGIFVSGGFNESPLASIVFYSLASDTWTSVGMLREARQYHSNLNLLADQTFLAVAAGWGEGATLANVEFFNGTHWSNDVQLGIGRAFHAEVQIPAAAVSCRTF